MRIDQAEHRERERGLARARFADDAERLARREIEAHVLHGGEAAALEPAAHARQMRRIVHVDFARFDQGAARRRRDIAVGPAVDELARIGMLRPLDHVRGAALLDHHALLHHRDAVGEAAHQVQVVRDEKERHSRLGAEVLEQLEDLQADGDIERSGRLIGDQQFRIAGERHGDHGALALPARELVRIAARAALGIVDADAAHGGDRLRPRRRAAQRRVQLERLDDLVADRVDRIQRRHRLLKNHRDVAAAHVAQLLVRHGEYFPALEPDAAAEPRVLDEPQRRERGHRLAGGRLAHERELLACVEREGNVVHDFAWTEMNT